MTDDTEQGGVTALRRTGEGDADVPRLRQEVIEHQCRTDAAEFVAAELADLVGKREAAALYARHIRAFMPFGRIDPLKTLEIDNVHDRIRYKGVLIEESAGGMFSLSLMIWTRMRRYVDLFKRRLIASYNNGGAIAGLLSPAQFKRFIESLCEGNALRRFSEDCTDLADEACGVP